MIPDSVHTIDEVPLDVRDLFERTALQVIKAGFKRYSARAISQRMRWHMNIEQGDRTFKINDHWTPPLARWFIQRHPQHQDFFELRQSAFA